LNIEHILAPTVDYRHQDFLEQNTPLFLLQIEHYKLRYSGQNRSLLLQHLLVHYTLHNQSVLSKDYLLPLQLDHYILQQL
jgi:hypothetical protein